MPQQIYGQPTTLPNPTAGVGYSQLVSATGGTPFYTFAVTSGSLPTGLTLDPAGTLSGTATQGGTSTFTITATDTNGFTGNRSYTLTITGGPTIVLSPTSLTNPMVGIGYSQTITANGGTPSYTFAITSGSLPNGMTLNSAGVITGTPTVAGTFNFTVTVTDTNNFTGNQPYTFTLAPPTISLNPTTLPTPLLGVGYSHMISANGGTTPYTFAVTSGTLPTGLTLNTNTGVIGGTPAAIGTFNFTITATDANSFSGNQPYTVTINAIPTITITPSTLTDPTLTVAYSQTLSGNGGTGPYTFAVSSGTLPTGLSVNSSTGVISGTPGATGTFNFTITATDANSFTGNQPYTVTVAITPTITLTPSTLPNPTLAVSYSQTLSGNGGTGPYTFAVSSGALPTGFSLNSSTGVISGTPSATGIFNFTITATDANSFSGNQPYTLTITTKPIITITPTTLPNPTLGVDYSQTLTAKGGTAPYQFIISSGALPPGLSLTSFGNIIGSATAAGTYRFTIKVTDKMGVTKSQTYQLIIIVLRPDPSQNSAIKGMVNAQASSNQFLTHAVINTLADHFQQLHRHLPPSTNNMRLGFKNPFSMQYQKEQDLNRQANQRLPHDQKKYEPEQTNKGSYSMSNLDLLTDKLSLSNLSLFNYPLSPWISGNMSYGRYNDVGQLDNRFLLESVVGGFDLQLRKTLIVGTGISYGNNKNEFSNNLVSPFNVLTQQASSFLYSTYEPKKNLFIDALLGIGSSSFNNKNYSTQIESMSSKRKGQLGFGSLGMSKQIQIKSILAQPFIRGDIIQARLGSFTEPYGPWELSFKPLNVSNISWNTGFTLSTTLLYDTWFLTPMLKTEYSYTSGTSNNQFLYYTDIGMETLSYNFQVYNYIKNIGSSSIWLNVHKDKGASIALGASGAFGSNFFLMQSIQLNLNYAFF